MKRLCWKSNTGFPGQRDELMEDEAAEVELKMVRAKHIGLEFWLEDVK